MTNRIAVHKEDHEGLIHIDAIEGRILTPGIDRPEWAEGYAVALLAERTGWYEKRLGQQMTAEQGRPEMLSANDLGWIGVDAEGSEVEIEADSDYRMDQLATLLGVDRQDFDQERNFKNSLASAEATHSYSTQPTTEATLEEIEGQTFEEQQKVAAQG